MNIKKIKIHNFKCFKDFELELNSDVNIIVGNNEAGKSTILEAIHLALTGVIGGRYLKNNASEYLFNKNAYEKYLSDVEKGNKGIDCLPEIYTELYFNDKENEKHFDIFRGKNNSEDTDARGVYIKYSFDEEYTNEYTDLVNSSEIKNIPIEYYKVTWKSFADEYMYLKNIPMKSALIDSTNTGSRNGSDMYVSHILENFLDKNDVIKLQQANRRVKEYLKKDDIFKTINDTIKESVKKSDSKKVEFSIDLSDNNDWQDNLIANINEIPFHYIGKGEQIITKTHLALLKANEKSKKNANVILLEEPENHLSFSKLNELLHNIEGAIKSDDTQLIVATHSSFVANKIGIEKLILINDKKTTKLNKLKLDTFNFFKKIAGYDTLRFILAESVILVEGASDELIIQKAYKDKYNILPIENKIDVISVGLSFERYLEIAEKINIKVIVVTDNDGDIEKLNEKYRKYENNKKIKICYSGYTYDKSTFSLNEDIKDYNYNTLEPNFVKANNNSLELFNKILETNHKNIENLLKYMKNNKADCALKIFDYKEKIEYPDYIMKAIEK